MTLLETGLQFPHHLAGDTVRAALAEDLGLAGDITTNALIPADAVSEATLALREDGRIAGLPLAIAAFRALDPEMAFEAQVREGAQALAGTAIARLSGKTRAILSAERVALNLVQRLSGVATATHHFRRGGGRHGRENRLHPEDNARPARLRKIRGAGGRRLQS